MTTLAAAALQQATPSLSSAGAWGVRELSMSIQAFLITRLPFGAGEQRLDSLWSVLTAAQPEQLQRILAAVLVLGIALLWHIRYRRYKHDMDKMPGPWREALPVVGNVLPMLRPDFHRKVLEYTDQYGGIFRFKQFLGRDAIFVSDPEALAVIMGRGEGACDKAATVYTPVNHMCDPHRSPNLLTSPADDKWKAVRKAVAVSFSVNNIKKKFPLIRERCTVLCERMAKLGPGAVVDVDQAALRVTLDVIGLAGFGHDYHAVEQDVPAPTHLLRVLPRCFTEVMQRVANPFRSMMPFMFKGTAKGSKAFEAFQAEMMVLLEGLKTRGTPTDDDHDIGAQLYRAMLETHGVDEARVLSEIGILFVEGFETTGHTTSWTLFNIATVPGVQERIAAELDSLGLLATPERPNPRPLELDDMKKLKYLTACTKEAMRMYPVVSIMGRTTPSNKMTKIGPYMVPPNTTVATALFAIHNTKHNWDEPLAFRPERWQDVPVEQYVADCRGRSSGSGQDGVDGEDSEWEASKQKASSKAITFMPFSEGPRNCVGQSLAKMEVLTLLAMLLSQFRLDLAPEMGGRDGVHSRESTHLTLQTKGTKGIRCTLHPRRNEAPRMSQ